MNITNILLEYFKNMETISQVCFMKMPRISLLYSTNSKTSY